MSNAPDLVRAALRDLVADVRRAERDGLPAYAKQCREEIARIWRKRHLARVDRHGQVQA